MREFRGRGYTGSGFVAISDDPETRQQMLRAGAAAACEKYDLALPDVVRRVVGGEQQRATKDGQEARSASSAANRHTPLPLPRATRNQLKARTPNP